MNRDWRPLYKGKFGQNKLSARFQNVRSAESLEARVVLAAQVELVQDFNTAPIADGADVANLTSSGDYLFFTANTAAFGNELWKSDGTAAGTRLVKDIRQGSLSSFPVENREVFAPPLPKALIDVNGTLFFVADDGIHGKELWKSDGTEAGTVLVKDIHPGAAGSRPTQLYNANGVLFFSADNGVSGRELWISDGTSEGTVLLADVRTGSASSEPENLLLSNGVVYFTANDGIHGFELWKTGTAPNSVSLVKDINAGPGSSNRSPVVEFKGQIYFGAGDTTSGFELWRSDGTEEGTSIVKDINPGVASAVADQLTVVGDKLFFTATDGADGRADKELWVSDGTEAGTKLARDVNALRDPGISQLIGLNGILYFSADDGVTGSTLWRSDGTDLGSYRVAKLSPIGVIPSGITAFNNEVYFFAANTGVRDSLWKSDGTSEGTKLVKALPGPLSPFYSQLPHKLVVQQDSLFFASNDPTDGFELWKSDGSTEGTFKINVDEAEHTADSQLNHIAAIGGSVYFAADDGLNGSELWRSDGPGKGATLVRDINSGAGSSKISSIKAVGSVLYFSADDGIHGQELWKSDGTEAGTVMVVDSRPGANDGYAWNLQSLNGNLYFNALKPDGTTAFWKTDGTSAGTELAWPSIEAIRGSIPSNWTVVGDNAYFVVSNGSQDNLWITDGSETGTKFVKSLAQDFNSPERSFASLDGKLYFRASSETAGSELWTSDGTEAGTTMVKDLRPGNASGLPTEITSVNGRLFFTTPARIGIKDAISVWASDGTPEGTYLLRTYERPPLNTIIPERQLFTDVNRVVYFKTYDGVHGEELWKSDGTAEGTVLLKDIHPEIDGGKIGLLVNAGNELYFTSYDGDQPELWKSDGTTEGTVRLADSDRERLDVQRFLPAGNHLFMVADSAKYGRELFVLDTSVANLAPTDIAITSSGISESAVIGSVVGRLSAVDPNASDAHTFSLVAGAGDTDNSLFEVVNGELVVKFNPDYETRNDYTIRVQAMDAGGLVYDKSLHIQVTDVVLAGDINNDDRVDARDFALLRTHFNKSGTRLEGDLDGDGVVGLLDFALLRSTYGEAVD